MRPVLAVFTLAALLLPALPAEAGPCDTDYCATGCLTACYMDSDEKKPGQGVAVNWDTMPVKYKYNIEDLVKDQGLKEADVVAAIDAAFKAWEGLTCSKLTFQNAGKSTSSSWETGYILVHFKTDKAWMGMYYTDLKWDMYKSGKMEYALIRLNATENHPKYDMKWSIGAEAKHFDIQTILTLLIPRAIGLIVEASDGMIPRDYNKVHHTLCQQHKDAAAYTYNDGTTACKKPTVPYCTKTAPKTDGGGTGSDGGGTGSDGGGTTNDSGGTGTNDTGGTIGGDGALPPPTDDDDGCCRVGHATKTSKLPFLVVIGLGLLLALARRRRR